MHGNVLSGSEPTEMRLFYSVLLFHLVPHHRQLQSCYESRVGQGWNEIEHISHFVETLVDMTRLQICERVLPVISLWAGIHWRTMFDEHLLSWLVILAADGEPRCIALSSAWLSVQMVDLICSILHSNTIPMASRSSSNGDVHESAISLVGRADDFFDLCRSP